MSDVLSLQIATWLLIFDAPGRGKVSRVVKGMFSYN